jgi:ATP-binding cassette subfamily C (CFTR/MRP) protein 1
MMNSSSFCSPDGDNFFGPQVEPCVRAFDFTLRFENTFLSIAPSALFLFIVPLRLFCLRNEQKRVVGGTTLQIVKLVSISVA